MGLYRTQVHIKRPDKTTFNKIRTSAKESLAKEWIKRLEAEILVNPAILNPEARVVSKSLEQFITQYLDEISDEFAHTKTSALQNICNYDIAHNSVLTNSKRTL